jgi:hypothetical protein
MFACSVLPRMRSQTLIQSCFKNCKPRLAARWRAVERCRPALRRFERKAAISHFPGRVVLLDVGAIDRRTFTRGVFFAEVEKRS